ncbi:MULTISPECIES: FkbM family methyltransferase [Hyphobacterium]|uniref:FkbM family methyltransferase n=1 Tax=Hyphobacterium vulgare TaxID=1736751 RepID=A0ABV6ZVG5_9PROT
MAPGKLTRRAVKAEALARLAALKVPVRTVIDVGVQTCTPELLRAYPGRPHLLIEPIAEFHSEIARNYKNTPHEIVSAALSRENGRAPMRLRSASPGGPITYAQLDESAAPSESHRTVDVLTLDSVCAARTLAKPYLLKIDVDGAEERVLDGARETLPHCSVVVLEVTFRDIPWRLNRLTRAGFTLFDIVDLAYYDGRWVQADLVFLNSRIEKEMGLEPYAGGLDMSKWEIARG